MHLSNLITGRHWVYGKKKKKSDLLRNQISSIKAISLITFSSSKVVATLFYLFIHLFLNQTIT